MNKCSNMGSVNDMVNAGVSSFGHHRQRVEISSGSGVHPKRTKQVIHQTENPLLMVVGADIAMNDIVLMNALTLVGWFGG